MKYTRHNPYQAIIAERFRIGGTELRGTYHLSLDLGASGITYEVGDYAVIVPQNDVESIDRLLESLAMSPDAVVSYRKSKPAAIRDVLLHQCDVIEITKALVALAGEPLAHLLPQEARPALKALIEEREVIDLIQSVPVEGITPQEFVDALKPLLPRFYSISSHAPSVPNELHLTVAHFHYTKCNFLRRGACTHYLCQLAPLHTPAISLYTQSSKDFSLPDDPEAAIVMIGPGTGVAPFRGFMQKRRHRGDPGKSWLFFGEKHLTSDFLYGDFWDSLVNEGRLRLTTAFSRDQAEKIYVQHRLWEEAEELYRWIEGGAYLFVCGNASHMAKDVETMLLRIFATYGGMKEAEAAVYLKELRQQGRYARDVY